MQLIFLQAEAKKNNVDIIVRVPWASGLLTGKMNNNSSFPKNDHRNYNINGDAFDVGETFSGVNFNKALDAVEDLKNILPTEITLSQLKKKGKENEWSYFKYGRYRQ